MRRAILSLFVFLCLTANVWAGEPTVRERVVGAAFKGLAGTFLAAYDLEKEKKNAVDRLEAMSDEKFKETYAQAWSILEGLPAGMRTQYGLSGTTTRPQLIAEIRKIRKDELRSLIQNIPDETVTREFDRHLQQVGGKLRQSDLAQQIESAWQRVRVKLRELGGKKA